MFGVRWGVLLVVVAAGAAAAAQGTAGAATAVVAAPVFDVSTIKPSRVEDDSMSVNWSENTYTAKNVQIDGLLSEAYGVREDLISGLPGWVKSEHFDIVAKATDLDPATLKGLSRDQQRNLSQGMMLRLVEDRFHVKAHKEVKQLPVYDLVVAKGGIKFKESGAKIGAEGCKGWMSSSGSDMKMECVPMETLTGNLAYRVHRTVIDKTRLPASAGYDMNLKWRRETDGALSDADLQLPTLFDALQEQLGLKLEPSKGPVETLVIDQIEKPTEN